MTLLTKDPNGVIPSNWKYQNQYEVVGFIEYDEEINILDMMVAIKYPDYIENNWGYSTTRDYIYVLKDYLSTVDCLVLEEAKHNWRIKKIEEFVKEHPEQKYMLDYVKGEL